MKKKIQYFLHNQEGSSTVEATIVYPSILIVTIVMVLFTIIVYQRCEVHYKARQVADNVAFIWNNQSSASADSAKPFNGQFSRYTTQPEGENDGLYWRFLSNQLKSDFKLPFLGGSTAADRKVVHANENAKASSMIVDVDYNPEGLFGPSQVVVEVTSSLSMPSILKNFLGYSEGIKAVASADVYDTPEAMRNTRLVLTISKTLVSKNTKIVEILEALGLM